MLNGLFVCWLTRKTSSNSNKPSQPDLVYGDIEPSQATGSAPMNVSEVNDAVLYSALQSNDIDGLVRKFGSDKPLRIY